MKYHGCILDFTDERNHELLTVFRNTIASRSFIDIEEVSEAVVNTPCSRFWVSEERALRVINALIKGLPVLRAMRPAKREMFKEIYRRFVKLRRSLPKASVFEGVIKVVNSPAPKFYMTPRSAMATIYKIKNGFYGKQERY